MFGALFVACVIGVPPRVMGVEIVALEVMFLFRLSRLPLSERGLTYVAMCEALISDPLVMDAEVELTLRALPAVRLFAVRASTVPLSWVP
jgi:hypothetical protein